MTELIIGSNEEVVTTEVTRLATEQYGFKNLEDPDVHYLNGFTSGTLGIEPIRNFCKELQKKPFRAKIQLGIIVGFEYCTPEAQNALLKELEDHSKSIHYILGTADETAILVTIKSRAQAKYLTTNLPKKNSKAAQELAEQILSPDSDSVALFAKITNKEWTKQEAEAILSALFEQRKRFAKPKLVLQLLQKSSEYLSNNITAKQVLTHLLFGLKRVEKN